MNPQKWLVAFLLLFVISWPSYADAGRGCCSWHGGQSYCDSSVGRWVCADGTYSPSCGCYRDTAPQAPPKPTVPDFPTDPKKTTMEYSVTTADDGTLDVFVNWEDINEVPSRDYSVKLSGFHSDPGPLTDTKVSEYTFHNITPGTYYLSLKTKVFGKWSQYMYWDNISVQKPVEPLVEKVENIPTIPIVEQTESTSIFDSFLSFLSNLFE